LKKKYWDVIDDLVISLKSKNIRVFTGIVCYYLLVISLNTLEDVKWQLAKFKGELRRKKWHEVNDYFMILPSNEIGIVKDLLLHKTREPNSTKYFESLIQKDDIIIDIGANIGYYVILEAFAAHQGKIYAIEPVEHNMDMLYSNLDLNARKNVFPTIAALGDSNEKNHFYIYDAGNLSSFVKHDQSKIVKEIEMEMTTLDSFVHDRVKNKPNIIRMDLEGYECQVIEGGKNVISQCDDLILFIEIHPKLASPPLIERMLATLENERFKVEKIFIEPLPREFGHIGIANLLREISEMPRYGSSENSFEELRNLLNKRATCHAFFSKCSRVKAQSSQEAVT